MNQKKLLHLFGLGKMGQALAYNLINNQYKVKAFDNSNPKIIFKHKNFKVIEQIDDMLIFKEDRSVILLCIPEGRGLDGLINYLIPKLIKGDIVIDLGNSNFKKTIKRSKKLSKIGVDLVDFGISGGPEGAMSNPSIMVGCSSKNTWHIIKRLASDLNKSYDQNPLSLLVGPTGSGHFVKMVHNAIEYAVMQMLAETVLLYEKSFIDCNNWNDLASCLKRSKVMSYLLDITINSFQEKRKSIETVKTREKPKLRVEHNGTGAWALIHSLENNIPMPSIARAVEHRLLSSSSISNQVDMPKSLNRNHKYISLSQETLVKLLELAILSAFIQGLSAFQVSKYTFNRKIKPRKALTIWSNKSILRGEILSLLLSFDQKFLSYGDINSCSKAKHFISDRIKELSFLKRETNILSEFCPCFFSGITFFLNTKETHSISKTINKQRNKFGGHKE